MNYFMNIMMMGMSMRMMMIMMIMMAMMMMLTMMIMMMMMMMMDDFLVWKPSHTLNACDYSNHVKFHTKLAHT